MKSAGVDRRQTLIVGFNGRGAVVWRDGRDRFAGIRCQRRLELESAVAALFELEAVDVSSAAQVRDSLMTMGGAQLLKDPLSN